MSGVENVVFRFFPLAETRDAVVLPDGMKTIATSGDQLVGIALMAGVEDQLIAWRVEDVVQRERQLDDAEVSAKVATDLRDDLDDPFADLLCKLGKLAAIELANVSRSVDVIEQTRHAEVRSGARRCNVRWAPDSSPGRR